MNNEDKGAVNYLDQFKQYLQDFTKKRTKKYEFMSYNPEEMSRFADEVSMFNRQIYQYSCVTRYH